MPDMSRFNMKITPDLDAVLADAAASADVSKSEYVRQALIEKLLVDGFAVELPTGTGWGGARVGAGRKASSKALREREEIPTTLGRKTAEDGSAGVVQDV